MKVLRFPLAKIAIWFTAGILFAFYAKPATMPVFVLSGVAVLLFSVAFYFSKNQFIQKVYFGISAYAAAFFAGIVAFVLHSGHSDANNYIHCVRDNEMQGLEVVLRERLKTTIHGNRYVALVKQIDGMPASGKILVGLNHAEFRQNLPVGTILKITANIVRHRQPKNPDQFDYGKYLENKSILAQVYAHASAVKIGKYPVKDAFYYSDKIRNSIIGNLEKSAFHKRELAVIAALILGQQQDIAADIVADYQFAGAVHILSVSGLHVGFILMFLTFALNFLPKNRPASYLKLSIIILSLWGFAVLAGLSPSVIRSVTMFSFVAVAMHLRRKTNIFHTLLVSALLILLFEPSFLFDVGFQLSYFALFFILWLQPVFIGLWQPQNKIGAYFWQILTVSFAAQIGTFPLSIYYFHQFPGLFFVTNLVVIPLLSVIMALGILAMIPAVFGTIPILLVKPLEGSIVMLNKIIGGIASFEQFIIRDIALNRWMMLGLYLSVIALVIWFQKPDFRKACLVLCSLLFFQCCTIGTHWIHESQSEWIVFNAYKSTLIAERNGQVITVFGNTETNTNNMFRAYATANFATKIKRGKLQNTAYFKTKKILIIDCLNVYPEAANPDVLVIRQAPKLNLERLLQTSKPKAVVADASNFKSYIKLWKATCEKYKIPFHNTSEMGFYKL